MKSITNCPGYFVNDSGEFFSCVKKISGVNGKRGTYTIIDESEPVKLTVTKHPSNGYGYICLGKYGRFRAHRLVAQTFIPNPDCLPEVNHKDRDKMNNSASNLEWCSRQRNAEHALSKHYIVENIATGEREEIFNLSAYCKKNSLHIGSLHDTLKQRQGRKQYKGLRLISFS